MGLRSWIAERGRPAPAMVAAGTPSVPARRGFEFGADVGQAASAARGISSRRDQMEELFNAYMTCSWASACIDTTAKRITAGGMRLVPDDSIPEGQEPPAPPEMGRLKRLMKFVNPREDLVQLVRSTITDLLVAGDGFIEVTRVLGEPVALYSLDAATMEVQADAHGEVTGYVQNLGPTKRAEFAPEDVIHVSLDSPRGGLYGTSPTQKALLPITAWLYVSGCLKERFRQGDAPRVHIDMPPGMGIDEQERWRARYRTRHLGARNMGVPIMTVGGGAVNELQSTQVIQWLDAQRQFRDEIISAYGQTPHVVGVIESGNLGGGTGEAQQKTIKANTDIPIAALVLEKLNYALVQQGFGITAWHLEFDEVDMRDSKVVEEIRDLRLRNGSYTLNRYRAEIGEPDVDGGDDPVLVQRQSVIFWADMADFSRAEIAQMEAKGPGSTADSVTSAAGHAPAPGVVPDARDAEQGAAPRESNGHRPMPGDQDMHEIAESWRAAYEARRAHALEVLPR